jgi:hypothetical protein
MSCVPVLTGGCMGHLPMQFDCCDFADTRFDVPTDRLQFTKCRLLRCDFDTGTIANFPGAGRRPRDARG